MYYLGFGILVVSTALVWIIKRDIWFPGLLVGVVWSFVYLLLLSTSLYVDYSSFIYLYVSMCVVAFEWITVVTSCLKVKCKNNHEYVKGVSYRHIDLTLIFLLIVLCTYLLKIISIIISSFSGIQSIVFVLKYAQIMGKLSTGLVPYVATFSFVFSSFLIYSYYNSEEENREYFKGRMKIALCLSFLYSVTLMGRVFVLQWAISNLGMMVFSSHIEKEKLKKMIFKVGIAVFVFFILYGLSKFFYRMDQMSVREMIDDTISVYVAGPLVGMQILIKKGVTPQNCKATLQFFYSLLNAVGFKFQQYNKVPYLILGPTDSLNGNVYTTFYYWIIDYGYVATFFLYQMIGIIHARIYSVAKKKRKGFNYTLISFAMYPLLMQFFDEQYLTQISWMIQVAVWTGLIYKTNFYIKRGQR